MSDITAELLREFIDYNQETGEFRWRFRDRKWFPDDRAWNSWNKRFPGTVAGAVSNSNYLSISILYHDYQAHRLAWLYVTGEWPKDQIDHIDGVRLHNMFENLREVSNSENGKNQGRNSKNKSGYMGVSWAKRDKRWKAQITVDGEKLRLGLFRTAEDAHAAYAAVAEAAGFSKRHIYGEVA